MKNGERRVLVRPVGQLGLVQFLEHAGLDLGFNELVGRHHQVVARVAGQQFGFQRLVGIEGVPGHFDPGFLGEILGHGRQDVIRPVVHPQFLIFGVHGAGQQRQPTNGGAQYAFHHDHEEFPKYVALVFMFCTRQALKLPEARKTGF